MSEVATFGGGHTPPMADSDNYEDGCVLWVTSQDVKSSCLDRTTTQITEKGAKELTLYPAGSLVMVTRSGILRHTLPVAELRKPSTVNQDIRVILPQDACCGGWLLWFFISRNKELLLEFGKTGTTVESVDFSKIKDMLLCMPNSVEQQQIGRFFAKLDDLITLHQRKCQYRGLYGYLSWEQRKLGELCELNPTAVLPDSFEYVDLESVAGTDMISHRREEKLTAPSRAQRLASFGDIFYQTVRPYQKNNYFYELPDEDYVFSTGYAQLRPLCDGRFLFSSLQRDQFVSCVLEHCTGTSYPAINANDLAALFLAVPIDAEEQRLVGSILKPIDSLITLHQRMCSIFCFCAFGSRTNFNQSSKDSFGYYATSVPCRRCARCHRRWLQAPLTSPRRLRFRFFLRWRFDRLASARKNSIISLMSCRSGSLSSPLRGSVACVSRVLDSGGGARLPCRISGAVGLRANHEEWRRARKSRRQT